MKFETEPQGIEKCSSPTGDGNKVVVNKCLDSGLRNVVPRQGTEIRFDYPDADDITD